MANPNTPSTTSTPKLTLIEIEFLKITVIRDAELAKGDRCNFSVLNSLSRRVVAFGDRDAVRMDHNHVHDRAARISIIVIKLIDSHGKDLGTVFAITSIVVSLGAAFMGLSPLVGEDIVKAATAKVLAAASQATSTVGTGLSQAATLVDKEKEGKKIGDNHAKDTLTRSLQNREQAMNQTHAQATKAVDHEGQANDAEHKARSAAAAA